MNKQANSIDPNLLVLVSNQLTGPDGVQVGFAFRTESDDPQDSGWNFWSGEETEEYVKDSDNFSRFPLQHFLELDESLEEILDAEIGTSWERDSETDSWIEAEEEEQ
jgi:hypothetical protein